MHQHGKADEKQDQWHMYLSFIYSSVFQRSTRSASIRLTCRNEERNGRFLWAFQLYVPHSEAPSHTQLPWQPWDPSAIMHLLKNKNLFVDTVPLRAKPFHWYKCSNSQICSLNLLRLEVNVQTILKHLYHQLQILLTLCQPSWDYLILVMVACFGVWLGKNRHNEGIWLKAKAAVLLMFDHCCVKLPSKSQRCRNEVSLWAVRLRRGAIGMKCLQ